MCTQAGIPLSIKLKVIAERLVLAGSQLNNREAGGWTIAHIAANSESTDTLKWILEMNKVLKERGFDGFDFKITGGPRCWTPLHMASYVGNIENIEEITKNTNVDIFFRSINNELPRHVSLNGVVNKILRKEEKKRVREHFKELRQDIQDLGRHNYNVSEKNLLYQHIQDIQIELRKNKLNSQPLPNLKRTL